MEQVTNKKEYWIKLHGERKIKGTYDLPAEEVTATIWTLKRLRQIGDDRHELNRLE